MIVGWKLQNVKWTTGGTRSAGKVRRFIPVDSVEKEDVFRADECCFLVEAQSSRTVNAVPNALRHASDQ